MFALPSVPSWDALHPGVSHFPIVLLVVAPVFLVVGLISPARRESCLALALWFTAAGTLAVYLSAATGDAAREVAQKTPEVVKAIEAHESAGSVVRAAFTVLTLGLAALRYGPRVVKKPLAPATAAVLTCVLLALYGVASLPLYNAAHSGGVLVHKLGVHAKL